MVKYSHQLQNVEQTGLPIGKENDGFNAKKLHQRLEWL
jgi:hypothetical protein